MTQEPSEDYLSRSETESWTWRVEDTWGEGGGHTAPTAPGFPGEPSDAPPAAPVKEESGEYLGADPLDTDWVRTWYTTEEPVEGSESSRGPESTQQGAREGEPAAVAGAPGKLPATAPLSAISLTPMVAKWDDSEELPVEREPRLQAFWDENGKRVVVPAALLLLLLVGIVLTVMNVMWATGA